MKHVLTGVMMNLLWMLDEVDKKYVRQWLVDEFNKWSPECQADS